MFNDRNHLRLCKSKRQPPWKKPKVDTAVPGLFSCYTSRHCVQGSFFPQQNVSNATENADERLRSTLKICNWHTLPWKIFKVSTYWYLPSQAWQPLPMKVFHSKKQVQDIRDAEHNLNTSGLIWRRTCGNICGISTQRTSLAGSVSPAVTTWSHLRAVPTWESKQWKVHHTRLSSRIQQLLKS